MFNIEFVCFYFPSVINRPSRPFRIRKSMLNTHLPPIKVDEVSDKKIPEIKPNVSKPDENEIESKDVETHNQFYQESTNSIRVQLSQKALPKQKFRVQPEISRAHLKSKTPINFSLDKKLRDLKTPSAALNGSGGRWSPIKIQSVKSAKFLKVIF
jgi:hypothetical protein